MPYHKQAGLRLLAAGLALVVLYAVLVWFAIFENGHAHQVCGEGVPHRDNFFPPYTSCGSGENGFRMTSAFEEYVGAALFVIGVALCLAGGALLIRSARDARRTLPRRQSSR